MLGKMAAKTIFSAKSCALELCFFGGRPLFVRGQVPQYLTLDHLHHMLYTTTTITTTPTTHTTWTLGVATCLVGRFDAAVTCWGKQSQNSHSLTYLSLSLSISRGLAHTLTVSSATCDGPWRYAPNSPTWKHLNASPTKSHFPWRSIYLAAYFVILFKTTNIFASDVQPGESPYHTIHPGDTSLDGWNVTGLKQNRSNSWSESLDDFRLAISNHGSNAPSNMPLASKTFIFIFK